MSRRSRKEQRRRQCAVEVRDRLAWPRDNEQRQLERPIVLRSFDQLVEQRSDSSVDRAEQVVRMRPMRNGYYWLWRGEELLR